MRVTLINKEKSEVLELPQGFTALDLAKKNHLTGPDQGLGAEINGTVRDLATPLNDGDQIQFLSFSDQIGKEMFWHTSAHVLAQAILRLFPDAQPTIGPPIEHGFYYDFANLHISDEDFVKIEEEMKKIVNENHLTHREKFASKQAAIDAFENNKYKVELIEGFDAAGEFTGYRQGEFFDLCRGPHIPNLGKIKAVKVLKTSGAYWRGDAKNEMLTRVYAITFPDRTLLKDYLTFIEEAKKRDHKVIGPRLDLFSLKEEAPGMPFIHPKGMIIWKKLLDFWKEIHDQANYVEIKTPVMMTKELWIRSGHWANYRENMFTSTVEEREFAIKPMNCPGGMLYFSSSNHSYRELPMRVAEIGNVHRFEHSGALSGLMRVRCFHQDDAHIFMKPDDIQKEILGVLELVDQVYSVFGLTYHLELSTRPEKSIGTDADWDMATKGLQGALDACGRAYKINPGDGAFYGPKIDIHIRDAIGRTWQCGTIQLDMALPERFDLQYTASDGSRQRPIMIHRVIYGSIERFFGILIEHFAGKFPMWISPRQIRILPVADRHFEYANALKKMFQNAGCNCEVDDSNESIGKKVRAAQLDQVNYMITVGDQEVERKTISLRTRDNVVHGEMRVDDYLVKVREEVRSRALVSPFSKTSEE
jgi:threonyl-tRNA synthetase